MIMNPNNILHLLKKSFDEPQYKIDSIITEAEKNFASHLESVIKDAIEDNLFIETFDTLNFEEDSVIPDPQLVDEDFEIKESEEDLQEVVKGVKKFLTPVDLEYKKKAVEFWKSGKKGNLKFDTVKHRFNKLNDKKQLHRWELQVSENGNRIEKLQKISDYVLDQFQNARERGLAIHDIDLKMWALRERDNTGLSKNSFTASAKWIQNFKLRHRIVSRKINKFVTQTHLKNKETLKKQADEFVENIKKEISIIGPDNVYNTDQSGFNLEMHAGRTLAFVGTLKVESLAQSINSLTHSYTIQPIITASGLLKSPLLIVTQEKGGCFGPIVEKTLYKAENIVTFASQSGKLSSKLAVQWFQDIFLPNTCVGERYLLCLDSWTGQTEKNFENVEKYGKDITVKIIPAGTTGMIQPLDVYTFRPWKNFLKQFSDLVMLYDFKINLHLRNNVLKLQSLTHNQFSSPRFINMFKYAWYKSGYTSEKPPRCGTPATYCFQNHEISCKFCDEAAVMKCSWCTISMCMDHFFDIEFKTKPHLCYNYKKDP